MSASAAGGQEPQFVDMPAKPAEQLQDIEGARVLAILGHSVTTDHISPAGNIKADSPAGRYLIEHGVEPKDFNSYGSRRGNHEVMMRGTFANVRTEHLVERQKRSIDGDCPLAHCPLVGHGSRWRQAASARLERTLWRMGETVGNRHGTIMVTAANVQG